MAVYKYPCGRYEYDPRPITVPRLRRKYCCRLFGCEECRYFNGTVYYKQSTLKEFRAWLRSEREEEQRHENP